MVGSRIFSYLSFRQKTEQMLRKEWTMGDKTITAIATARGQAGIGVIRVSGDEAVQIADRVFKSASGKKVKDLSGYSALYGRVYDGEECVDEVITLVFKAPKSYTGEDVVEIQCHGGIFVTEQILKMILDNGAVLASPGEFTQRAFLNGKLDLTEAEAVMGIISAQGKQASRAALAMRDGALSKRIASIKNELLDLAAHLSIFSDYPDEDIPELSEESLDKSLCKVKERLERLLNTYNDGKLVREGIDTVIVGKPNVGKSTIMNFLSGTARSIVTNIPGTTRDVVEETVTFGDFVLKIADTAGIRETYDIVERIGVERAKNKIKSADLILMVFDLSREISVEDAELLNLANANTIAIFNKSDLERKFVCNEVLNKINRVVYLSAESGEGFENLKKEISQVVQAEKINPNEGMILNQRQFMNVKSALSNVIEAMNALKDGFTLDAITVLIEDAIGDLLKLTGERVTESVTNEVFSKFCVGK